MQDSEGSSFAQNGNSGGARKGTQSDEDFWADKKCQNCKKLGHPAAECPKKKKKSDDDDKSVGSGKTKSSKSSKSSKSTKDALAELGKMKKQWKKQKKMFTTLETQLEEREDSDLSDSDDDDEEEQSHFQFAFTQSYTMGDKLSQVHSTLVGKLDMRSVILLDNESTMDLFCDKKFVTDVAEADGNITVSGNGGTLVVKRKATLKGYHSRVWFEKWAITNILSLANVDKQYRVTYDSGDSKGLVVHRVTAGLPDMHFKLTRVWTTHI